VSAWLRGRARKGQHLTLTPAVEVILSDPGSPAIGPAAAAVTIVLFTDYQCPICKATDPALQDLIDADPTVRVIFKDWPIFGEASKLAAMAALASAPQGKYRILHQALMANRTPLDAQQIERVAREAGADWNQLAATQQARASALEAQLAKHALQAFSLGLQGTPAYIVGADLIQGGLDAGHLAQAVRKARRDGPLALEEA